MTSSVGGSASKRIKWSESDSFWDLYCCSIFSFGGTSHPTNAHYYDCRPNPIRTAASDS